MTFTFTKPKNIRYTENSIGNKIPGVKYVSWVFSIGFGKTSAKPYIRILGCKVSF